MKLHTYIGCLCQRSHLTIPSDPERLRTVLGPRSGSLVAGRQVSLSRLLYDLTYALEGGLIKYTIE
jgi:hypothetical protein